MLLILGTGLFLTLMGRMFFMQGSVVANPQLVRTGQSERWSRKFGPVVKVDRMMKEVIQNEETKEPFA